MKRYFAMLLVVMMLAGSFVSYADKVNDGEIELTLDDSDAVAIEGVEALDDDIVLSEEEVGVEEVILDELALDLEGMEEQEYQDADREEADAAIATNDSSVTVGDYAYTFSNGRACIN